MRSSDLFIRAAICAAGFIVVSLLIAEHQYTNLKLLETNNLIRPHSRLEERRLAEMDDLTNRLKGKSHSRLTERRLAKMRDMTSRFKGKSLQASVGESLSETNDVMHPQSLSTKKQLAGMRESTRRLKEKRHQESVGESVPAASSTDDPCHQLRASNSSLVIATPYAGACKHPLVSELEYPLKPLSIATIIPGLAGEKDAAFIPKVLESLQAETVASHEVVIAVSGVYDRVGVRYRHRMETKFSQFDTRKASYFCADLLEDFQKIYNKSPIKLLCIGERLSSGRARNAAIAASSSDILAFIDSDDTVYPIRNEVIQNVFNDSMPCREHKEYPLQMFLHSHKRKEHKQHHYEKARDYHLPSTSKVLPEGWTGEQCLEQEDGLEINNGRRLLASMAEHPSKWMIHKDLANGHPVIRRSAFDKVHFSSIPKGQDLILLRDLLYTLTPSEAEQSVLFVNRPLTTYYVAGKANADLTTVSPSQVGSTDQSQPEQVPPTRLRKSGIDALSEADTVPF